MASPQQSLCSRHPPSDVSRSRISSSLLRTISAGDRDCRCGVDSGHLSVRENSRTQPVELAPAMELRRLGGSAARLCGRSRDSPFNQVRSEELSPPFSSCTWPLHALGVLASVGVLLSCRSQLPLARDPLSQLHPADGGEPRHLLRWLRR